MKHRLGQVIPIKMDSIPRDNNFDLLRFFFAAIVFLVHAGELSQSTQLLIFSDIFSSKLAVQAFFVVSGFLIFWSYENSKSLKEYFEKRLRRIYPAYFVVVVGCAIIGSTVSSFAWTDYFRSVELYKYLAANLIFMNFLHPELPGLFVTNHLAAVNGALWTLKIEVMFYLTIPLMVWMFRRIGHWQGLMAIFISSWCYWQWMDSLADARGGMYWELQRQLPGQLMYFVAGGALFYYYPYFVRHVRMCMVAAILGLLIDHYHQVVWLRALSLAVVVIYFALILRQRLSFGKYGDLSYGVYILHFPIVQLMISKGYFDNPWVGFSMSTVLILVFAGLLWHFVEKPMLKKSSHYVEASQARGGLLWRLNQ